MKKIILSILLCFFLCDIASATQGQHCSEDCITSGDRKEDCLAPKHLNKVSFDNVRCAVDPRLAEMGFGNARIGWGRSCMIPAGEQTPSSYSCISTGNIMGQLLDTLLTAFIGTRMRANFCSFDPGRFPNKLEGAIIQRKLLDRCQNLPGPIAQNCIGCLLKGKIPSGRAGTSCSYDPKIPDPLTLDNYINKDERNPSIQICNGIPNIERPLLDQFGNRIYEDGMPLYCPITRCNIPTNHIMNKYFDAVGPRSSIIAAFYGVGWILSLVSLSTGSCCDIERLENGQSKDVALLGFVKIRGRIEGDRMCTQMNFGLSGWTTIACKPRIPPEIEVPANACFVDNILSSGFKSKWIFPITSQVVQIITEVFNSMFAGMPNCQNGLTAFQDNMKSIVRVLLVLYVIILGFKMVTGGGNIGKKEIFMFLLKFGLVIYFSVGTFNSTTTSSNNGLIWLRQTLTTATSSFSNMIVDAADPKICSFSKVSYEKGYEYLKMWDALDCKIAYYLGLSSPTDVGLAIHKSGTYISQVAAGILSLMWGVLADIFGGSLFIVLFIFAFGILLLSMVVYFTYLYILSMIAITIMIFFGPIFVPMALFDQTKEYFDSWLRLLLGYALQPVVVVGVLSLMIATFDQIIYSDCNFTQKEVSSGRPYWTFAGNNQSEVCKSTLGYNLAFLINGNYVNDAPANGDTNTSLYKYEVATKNLTKDLLEGLMLSTFFAFLFYYFSSQIGALAEELSGAPSPSGAAIGPTAVFDSFRDALRAKKLEKPKEGGKTAPNNQARSGVSVEGTGGGAETSVQGTGGGAGMSVHGKGATPGPSEDRKGVLDKFDRNLYTSPLERSITGQQDVNMGDRFFRKQRDARQAAAETAAEVAIDKAREGKLEITPEATQNKENEEANKGKQGEAERKEKREEEATQKAKETKQKTEEEGAKQKAEEAKQKEEDAKPKTEEDKE